MKSSPKTTEWPQSRPGVNFVIVLIALNCLLLVVQLSSNLTTYERSWWPGMSNTRTKLFPICSNSSLTNPVEENLHTSSLDLSRGEVQTFKPHGVAARLLVEVGAYRNGPRRFSFVAMGSKRLNNLHDHLYECEWQNLEGKSMQQANRTRTIKPDWNMGRIYGTLVIVCDFDHEVGTKSEGGRLVITARYPDVYRTPEKFVALIEDPGKYNASRFQPPYPYEIAFCGSPLYGDISPQRIREWMAYHALLFGENSIFIFQDAGGIHSDVYRVLQPWIELGRVRVLNLRKAEVYEGYYHHQFTMLNDCLLRTQTLANWTFFFDVDEFLYLPDGGAGLVELLKNSTRNNVTQIHFKNVKMSADLCRRGSNVKVGSSLSPEFARKWAFEKLLFANCNYGFEPVESRKYALQPRLVWATGVHYSEHLISGSEVDVNASLFRSYHYHNTISVRGEVCREFPTGFNGEPNKLNITNCTVDRTMAALAPVVKQYELAVIGEQPFIL